MVPIIYEHIIASKTKNLEKEMRIYFKEIICCLLINRSKGGVILDD
ncbi:hypothetical protein [Romboutsia ilealis]|nr:hypothetical protein [Romboutsia ilealis]